MNDEANAHSLVIVYEDEWLLVVDKPSGLLMHPSWLDRKEKDTLASRIKAYLSGGGYQGKVHTVHRLDRPTSGLVMIAKDDEVAKKLAEQFKERSIKKIYWAICRGFAPELTVVDYALKEELDKIGDKHASKPREEQTAKTSFRRLGIAECAAPVSRYNKSRYSWLECSPLTGRKHQIRRHLKHIRHPILGDTKYGCRHHNKVAKNEFELGSLALRSVSIGFTHPVKNCWIEVDAPVNQQWTKWLKWLGWAE